MMVHAAVMPNEALAFDLRQDLVGANVTTNKTCAARVGCGNCTDDDSCVWCDSDNLCKNGTWYGPDGEIISGCMDWRWKQCKGSSLSFLDVLCAVC
jgi:hypothetical protein